MGFSSVGVDSTVVVPSAVVVSSAAAVGGRSVAIGSAAVGMGGIGVDLAAGAMMIGVGEAPPQPLRRDITKVVAIPHSSNCRSLIFRSFHGFSTTKSGVNLPFGWAGSALTFAFRKGSLLMLGENLQAAIILTWRIFPVARGFV